MTPSEPTPTPPSFARRVALAAAACAALLAGSAAAAPARQDPPQPAAEAQATTTVERDSPRASLERYLEFCRAGDFASASRYLALPRELRARGPELARRLKAVLDRHLWIDLSAVSARSEGDAADRLPAGTDQVGEVPGPSGPKEPVRLVRVEDPEDARWAFSTGTVQRVDVWYDGLENRWALEFLPEPLLKPGPQELLWWQWLALPILAIFAWLFGGILGRITRGILTRLSKRTTVTWDDQVLERLGAPLTLAWTFAGFWVCLPLLGLYEPAQDFLRRLMSSGLYVSFFWGLLRTVDVIGLIASKSAWATSHPASRSLVPLSVRCLKVIIVVIAVIAVLADLGYPVASLVAGLGIGGLAFALAAQKTVENLFGAFAIGVDQPIREGDFVKIDDFVGTVEAIGLRSTRIRTLDRTIVSLPNGRLSDMRLESFTVRDRFRLATTIGVVYGTTADQMRQILEGFERVLRGHPKNWPDAVVVRFKEFGASSLDIEIMAWFETGDWGGFQLARQEVLIGFMDVVEKAGSSFAFPTRTVHLVQEKAAS